MGRKQKIKKERNAIKHTNITIHNLLDDGKEYKVQEYHPKNTSHMDYDLFKEMRLVGITPVDYVEKVLSKLIFRYPQRRFAIAVEKEYEIGEHDIPIFSYPPLNELELKDFEGLMNSS